ncbi:MAG: LLM class F420-dependent oxidoreductase [Kutzneria sp.]|nr:LLM class F420-dependent oxidoreductase [Kutzneria sp.]MBV9845479.1 LLM class F420-dependent oxidoreductase [Kutzneria sp.]
MTEFGYAKYPVRIGVQIQPQRCTYAEIRRTAAELEELGVDALFNWDHFFPMYGPENGEHYECWTVLAAWAESTERVELGPLVTCNSYRNPDLLADMARTVDHISGGRLIFGIGAGWHERDYREYGYEFGTAGSRLDALGLALPRIEDRWSMLDPPPTRKMPVLIGGNGERKTLRLAARHADIWHGFGDAATLAAKHRTLDKWCVEIGRDPAEIERSTRVFRKSPEEVGQDLIDIGTRLITLVAQVPTFDGGHVRDWLAFRDDVNR